MPEGASYPDNGCEVAPRCAACPLPDCKYAVTPKQRWDFQNGERNALIRAAAALGAERGEIAKAAGLSERSVYRLIQEAK